MRESPELTFSPEDDKEITTKIILEFMRHGDKEIDKTKTDEEILLSPKGRMQAVEKGKELDPQAEVSLAWASPRKRTQETAYHAMLANEENINPDASLEEIENAISQEVKVGRKLIQDKRLNLGSDGPMRKELLDAYKNGQYIRFLVEKSDQRAIDLGDQISSSYSRFAGNIAEIIYRYIKVANNFNSIAGKTDKYEEYGNQLERYLVTHQGIMESFIAKVLEKKRGIGERDKFVKAIGESFSETQGIHMEINNQGNKQTILMDYPILDEKGNPIKETLKIDEDLLEEIIKERDQFEEKVKK